MVCFAFSACALVKRMQAASEQSLKTKIEIDKSCQVTLLVRSDAARERLRSAGVHGVMLTAAEAKGLEFDLVILCGFLADCDEPRLWQVSLALGRR